MSDSRLHVCLVAPVQPPYGGISHWVEMIYQYADIREDVRLTIVDIAPRWRKIHESNILWKRIIGGTFQFLRDIIRFFKVLLSKHPDVVHLTTSGQLAVLRDYFFMVVSGLFRVPVIYHIHFGRVPQIAVTHSFEWRYMARAMRKAHTVVAIDHTTQKAITQFLPEVNVVQIPNCFNPLNLPKTESQTASAIKAIFVGWVIPTKGIGELVDAWSRLNLSDEQLNIVGPGDLKYREQLMNTFHPQRIKFLGELPHFEALKRMAEADILILPSYTEGFPNVIVEAMALGKAIVATRVGGIPEMLADECGLLIKPQETQELADSLSQLFADINMREKLGRRAKRRAMTEYTIEVVFSKYLNIWRHAAKKE